MPFLSNDVDRVKALAEAKDGHGNLKNPPAQPAPVASIAEQRAKGKGTSKGKEPLVAPDVEERIKPTPELCYADYFAGRDDLRVGGAIDRQGTVERKFYEWNDDQRSGQFWKVMNDDRARNIAVTWLKRNVPNKGRSSLGQSCVETTMDLYCFDSEQSISQRDHKDVVMPVLGAYLHIKADGTIVAHKPTKEAGMTHCVPAKFDWSRVGADGIYTPRSVDPNSAFGKYLDLFMADLEVRQLLQEAVGSSLLPTAFEKGFMLTGGGSNGKSTLLHLLRTLHPRNFALSLDKLDSEFSMGNLPGMTLALSTESAPFIGIKAEQRIKALISRDPIAVREPFKPEITVVPRCSVWFACNKPIRFVDRTYGLTSKIVTIPFLGFKSRTSDSVILDYHRTITDSETEMSQLLDWALEGAARLRRQGNRFSELPEAAKAVSESHRLETDPLYAYFMEVDLRTETHAESSKAEIYADYVSSMHTSENRPVCNGEFWKAVGDHVMKTEGVRLRGRQPGGGARHAKRLSRMVNVSIHGVKSDPFDWDKTALRHSAPERLDPPDIVF